MDLDTLSYNNRIQKAVNQVRSLAAESGWVLLGYVDRGKKSSIMTVNVQGEGIAWIDLLESFEDDKIQYGYAKVGLGDNTKLFLIHWVGKDVGENHKIRCMPHLNEIRTLILCYDSLVTSMDKQDVQSKVHCSLSRAQPICVETRLRAKSRRHSAMLQVSPDSTDGNEKVKRKTTSLRVRNRRRSETLCEEATEPVEGPSSFTSFTTQKRTQPKVKVAIVGSSGVGKSSIYMSYQYGGCGQMNPHGIKMTLTDLMSKEVMLGKHNFILEIWDTAGQERYAAFTSMFTRHAKVVICVYDIVDKQSYSDVSRHIQEAKEYADPSAVFFLVGNKADLVHRREIQETDAENFALQHGMTFLECSGLTGLNILKLFESITKHVVFTYPEIFNSPDESSSGVIKLASNASYPHQVRGCQHCK